MHTSAPFSYFCVSLNLHLTDKAKSHSIGAKTAKLQKKAFLISIFTSKYFICLAIFILKVYCAAWAIKSDSIKKPALLVKVWHKQHESLFSIYFVIQNV